MTLRASAWRAMSTKLFERSPLAFVVNVVLNTHKHTAQHRGIGKICVFLLISLERHPARSYGRSLATTFCGERWHKLRTVPRLV